MDSIPNTTQEEQSSNTDTPSEISTEKLSSEKEPTPPCQDETKTNAPTVEKEKQNTIQRLESASSECVVTATATTTSPTSSVDEDDFEQVSNPSKDNEVFLSDENKDLKTNQENLKKEEETQCCFTKYPLQWSAAIVLGVVVLIGGILAKNKPQ